jgi:hypothetical protein
MVKLNISNCICLVFLDKNDTITLKLAPQVIDSNLENFSLGCQALGKCSLQYSNTTL